ncbi:MAG: hypothetical protein HQL69_20455 [Magnetococcales bacterium]|nr:hypothetical protein [Magnetococcales bacterium]
MAVDISDGLPDDSANGIDFGGFLNGALSSVLDYGKTLAQVKLQREAMQHQNVVASSQPQQNVAPIAVRETVLPSQAVNAIKHPVVIGAGVLVVGLILYRVMK